MITKPQFESLLSENPYIDKIWLWPKKPSSLIQNLKDEGFDYIIDLHKNIRSIRLCFSLGVRRLTYDKTTWEKWLLLNFRINKLPKLHVVDRYLNACKKLNIRNDHKGLDFFLSDNTNIEKYHLPIQYLVIVIGATHFTKRFPTHKWQQLLDLLSIPVVILGGNAEKEDAKKIFDHHPQNNYNLVGKTTLQESAYIIKHAACIISNDTGMLHIAASFNKNIVSIWGGTIKEYGFWPYFAQGKGNNINVEIENLSCRPCSKFGRHNCPKGHFHCMEKINEKNIIDAVTLFTH